MKYLRNKIHNIFLISCILLVVGCASHLHNTDDQMLAEQARQQFEDLKKAQIGLFDTMSDNLATMSQAEVKLYKELADRQTEIVARQVPTMKWGKIRSELSEFANQMDMEVVSLESNIQQELENAGKRSAAHKAASKTADEALVNAKADLTNWNKRVAVLDKLIETIPSIEMALANVNDEDDFRNEAEKIAKDLQTQVKDTNVTFMDADGNEKTVPLKDELISILNVNDALIKGKTGVGKILAGLRAVMKDDAPGLMVTIASMAKDLADLQRQRTLAEIDSLEKRMKSVERARRLADLAKSLATEGASMVQAAKLPEENIAENTLKKLAEEKLKERLAMAILVMQHYVTISAPISIRLEEVMRDDAYLQHLQSIEISRISTSEHQALIDRGIEGLVIYHQGGIKPEEIADLVYRAVQLGFLGWIGAGVN